MVSQLIVSGADAAAIRQATQSAADAVVIDLADSVPPDEKGAVRAQAVSLLRTLNWGDKRTVVRINRLDTPWAYADLKYVVQEAADCLHAVAVPDVRRPADLYAVDALLSQVSRNGSAHRRLGIEAHIGLDLEGGPAAVSAIVEATPLLDALVIYPGEWAGLLWQREQAWVPDGFPSHGSDVLERVHALLAAAQARQLPVVDGPPSPHATEGDVWRACRLSLGIGMSGKQCWKEEHARIIRNVFAPWDTDLPLSLRRLQEYALATGGEPAAVALRHSEGGGITLLPPWARG